MVRPMSRPSEEVSCPECGTENPLNSKYCESCGLRLVEKIVQAAADEQEQPPPTPTRSRRGSRRSGRSRRGGEEADAPTVARGAERREIERTVAQARSKLQLIRNTLFLMAILQGVLLLGTWLRYGEAIDMSLALAILGSAAALLLCAGIFLFDQPLFWVTSCAGLCTVFAVYFGYFSNWLHFGLNALIGGGLWATLPMILNLLRLQREHPELANADRLRSRSRSRMSEAAAERLEELEARRKQRAMRSYGIVAAVVLGGVGLIFTVNLFKKWEVEAREKERAEQRQAAAAARREANKPLTEAEKAAFDRALTRFSRSWAHDDLDALKQLGNAEFAEERWSGFMRALRRRDWTEDLPDIEDPTLQHQRRRETLAVYRILPKGELRTYWVLAGETEWKLRRVVPAYTR